MPLNKNAFIRYHIIDNCLRSNQRYSIEKIIAAIENKLAVKISKSTIEKDFKNMRELPEPLSYAPIKYNRLENYYFYENKTFSISQANINETDIETIQLASFILDKYQHISIIQDLLLLFGKIKNAIPNFDKINNSSNTTFISTKIEIQESKYYKTIIDCVKNYDVISLTYKAFDNENETIYNLHPYLIKENENRIYVIGYCEEYSKIRTFALDRIVSVRVEKSKKFISIPFDPVEFYKYSIGIISKETKPEKVKLCFTKLQSKYLLSKPLHASQRIVKETKTKVIFEFFVHISYELESKILSWGNSVEVISPKKLKQKIINQLKESLNQYLKANI